MTKRHKAKTYTFENILFSEKYYKIQKVIVNIYEKNILLTSTERGSSYFGLSCLFCFKISTGVGMKPACLSLSRIVDLINLT